MALQNQAIPGTDIVVIHSCVSNSQISQNAELMSMAYYIGDTHRTNRQGQPVFGLFQKSLEGGERMELAAGVEQMQILYGLAINPQAVLVYYPAGQVEDWQSRTRRTNRFITGFYRRHINEITNLLFSWTNADC